MCGDPFSFTSRVLYAPAVVTLEQVTKRATTLDSTAKTLEWSEYSRLADLSSGGALEGRGGVPEISARWTRARFRMDTDATRAEALTLEYFLPPGNPDPAAATMKLKYRTLFQREGAARAASAREEEEEEDEADGE